MISLSLDLGNSLSVLAALADSRNQRLISGAMAESYNDDIHNLISAGSAFTPRSGGGLEQAINWHPNSDGSATVYANKDYAGYVEHGTGIFAGHNEWDVFPGAGRKALRWAVSGGAGFLFAKKVHHKGMQARPYFFADQSARQEHMQERALSVLAARIAHG